MSFDLLAVDRDVGLIFPSNAEVDLVCIFYGCAERILRVLEMRVKRRDQGLYLKVGQRWWMKDLVLGLRSQAKKQI